MENEQKDILLHVEDLCSGFMTREGYVPAVDHVSFDIPRGEVTAIVGESGCGKSVTALSVLRLLKEPPAVIKAEHMCFDGKELLTLNDTEIRGIRGNKISMIFQEPMTSLNPLMTISRQIMEPLRLHQGMTKHQARAKTLELLKQVGIPDAESRMDDYPHQLSGGMRQRVMIAMALACNPLLLIADEPTTALDVTIQAQILDMITDMQRDLGIAVIMITHNLGIVAEMAQNVIVMYAGQIVEKMPVYQTFTHPWHPYTHGLLKSIPTGSDEKLNVIEGYVPNPLFYPKGCRFSNRCPYATDKCREEAPELVEAGDKDHYVRCFYPLKDERGIID